MSNNVFEYLVKLSRTSPIPRDVSLHVDGKLYSFASGVQMTEISKENCVQPGVIYVTWDKLEPDLKVSSSVIIQDLLLGSLRVEDGESPMNSMEIVRKLLMGW